MLEVEVFGAETSRPAAAASPPSARSVPPPQEIQRLCALAAGAVGIHEGHVAIEFVDARRIAELNARYRALQEATDVLSFPVDGAEPLAGAVARELGDVVICLEHTADVREALVHGVLHLVGLDHETDDGEMLELQRQLLEREDG
jgi:probable rRNA maturation factor